MDSHIFRGLITVSSLALASVAFGSTRRDDKPDSSYVNLSNLATYSSVGQISTNSALGSGTLISSTWMLTAAHVLSNANTTKNFLLGGSTYAIDNVIRYTDSFTSGVDDLALCHLSSAVTGITPAKVWNGSNEVGKVGTSVGYGGTGTGLTGNTGSLGRRAFQNVIDGYNQYGLNGLSSDFDNPTGTSNPIGTATALDLEGCVTPGDSGGSLWANFGGADYVVGVTSYVWWTTSGPRSNYGFYGDGSGYSRLDDYSSWIFQNTGVQAVPEPSAMGALGLASLVVLRRRRKA